MENTNVPANVLTTPFDMYATIRHLMNLNTNKTQYRFGRSLLSHIDPMNRTCESAGIKSHWCPCLQTMNINVTNSKVVDIAERVVEFMNMLLCKVTETCDKCSSLTLKKVIKAGRRTTKKELRGFSGKRGKRTKVIYEVMFEVAPSGGLFETTVRVTFDSNENITDVNVSEQSLSRINMYRDQPKCVEKTFPHLMKYCLCK